MFLISSEHERKKIYEYKLCKNEHDVKKPVIRKLNITVGLRCAVALFTYSQTGEKINAIERDKRSLLRAVK
jgi:hypothetical protein